MFHQLQDMNLERFLRSNGKQTLLVKFEMETLHVILSYFFFLIRSDIKDLKFKLPCFMY